jgi:hypothetical protein
MNLASAQQKLEVENKTKPPPIKLQLVTKSLSQNSSEGENADNGGDVVDDVEASFSLEVVVNKVDHLFQSMSTMEKNHGDAVTNAIHNRLLSSLDSYTGIMTQTSDIYVFIREPKSCTHFITNGAKIRLSYKYIHIRSLIDHE